MKVIVTHNNLVPSEVHVDDLTSLYRSNHCFSFKKVKNDYLGAKSEIHIDAKLLEEIVHAKQKNINLNRKPVDFCSDFLSSTGFVYDEGNWILKDRDRSVATFLFITLINEVFLLGIVLQCQFSFHF